MVWVYELHWWSSVSQILNKAEIQVICVECGDLIRSLNYRDYEG
jgi:hypothetical protein